jgi:hypothetical protein
MDWVSWKKFEWNLLDTPIWTTAKHSLKSAATSITNFQRLVMDRHNGYTTGSKRKLKKGTPMKHSCRARLCDTPHEEPPIDTGFTDETIVIDCAECIIREMGIDAMMAHILDAHAEYTAAEAANTARVWMDSAYEREEEEIRSREGDDD